MTFSITPPVGTPIPTEITPTDRQLSDWFNAHAFALLQSGTAALALGLHVSHLVEPTKTEVIIPGYGCPDLVAAIVHAGLTPVIVDVSLVPYSYEPEVLELSVNAQTLAIVCPTLFGLRMNCNTLRQRLQNHVLLIEDNAQWFPGTLSEPAAMSTLSEQGIFDETFNATDLSIISFGRGKPINLLGGGALFLHNRALLAEFSAALEQFSLTAFHSEDLPSATLSFGYQIKAKLFNALCKPILYGAMSKLPFLGLGETVFHPLDRIAHLNLDAIKLMPTAIEAYITTPSNAELAYRKAWPDNRFVSQSPNRLLRYPLIFESQQSRNFALSNLMESGLGASPFYNAILSDIDGVDEHIKQYVPIQKASLLANNMLTLPTHAHLTSTQIEQCISTIQRLPTKAIHTFE